MRVLIISSIAVQTFGDFQNFNPHFHVIATDGCFSCHGAFQVGEALSPHDLEDLFRHEVLKMLKTEGKISDAVIENMLSWHHSVVPLYTVLKKWITVKILMASVFQKMQS